jgi:hypothetical protein
MLAVVEMQAGSRRPLTWRWLVKRYASVEKAYHATGRQRDRQVVAASNSIISN